MSHIVLTGASRGIGRDTCIALAQKGASKILGGSRNGSSLASLKNVIHELSPEVEFIPLELDISQDSSMAILSAHIETTLGSRVDALVNNAGLLVSKPFEELSIADFKLIYDVNVFGAVRMVKACLPYIRTGHVLNISSIGGEQGTVKFPGLSAYSSSKGAMTIFTECLAEELKDAKIKVNALALGAVQTEMLAEAFPGYQAPVSAKEMGAYVAQFVLNDWKMYNGKVLSISSSTP